MRPNRWMLVVAALLPVLGALSPRDLWAPDEPRYGRIAYDMERGGDWLVSRWNGELDAEKPPLGYWIMAAGGRVGGEVDAWAARVPCALLAALAVLLTAVLGRRWFRDAALADTAALLFSATGLVLWNSSRAGLDLPLTAWVLLAAWAGTAFIQRPAKRTALAMGAALGMGILFKGPHVLYVPVGAVLGACLASGQVRRLRDARWLLALVAILALVAAWLVPVLLWGGPEFSERMLGQLQSRVSGKGEPHLHAFPYLLGLVLACGLPWTPAWLAGLFTACRARRAPEGDRFGLGAAAGGTFVALLLLSLAASKRDVYLIPLLPCLALLAAYVLHRLPGSRPARDSAWWFTAVLAGIAVMSLAAPLVLPHVVPKGPHEVVTGEDFTTGIRPWVFVGIGAGLALCAVIAFRRRRTPAAAARTTGLALGGAWVACALLLLPVLDEVSTWNQVATPLRAAARDARLVQLGAPDALLVWAVRPAQVELLAPGPGEIAPTLDALYAEGAPRVVTCLDTKYWEAAQATIPSLTARTRVLWSRRVSHRRWTVLVPAP